MEHLFPHVRRNDDFFGRGLEQEARPLKIVVRGNATQRTVRVSVAKRCTAWRTTVDFSRIITEKCAASCCHAENTNSAPCCHSENTKHQQQFFFVFDCCLNNAWCAAAQSQNLLVPAFSQKAPTSVFIAFDSNLNKVLCSAHFPHNQEKCADSHFCAVKCNHNFLKFAQCLDNDKRSVLCCVANLDLS